MKHSADVDLAAIKAISFDLDDTLWAIAPVIEKAEQVTRAWLIANYPDTEEFFNTSSVLELRQQVFAEYPDQHYDLAFMRRECTGRILETGGYDRSGVEQAFEVFNHQRNSLELYEDVMPFFEQLDQSMIRIVLTNGTANLERTPLKDSFHTHLNAIKVKSAKPESPMFTTALETHGLEPHQMLHVGDCLIADIGGAMELGIPTVWVNRYSRTWNDPYHRPHFIVNDFTQLTHLLKV